MDQFSERFANRLLAAHPEWREAIELKQDHLIVNFPSLSDKANWPLFVSTEDQEVTVGFDRWHTHFFQFADKDEEEEGMAKAIELVEQILDESVVVVSLMDADKWAGSGTALAGEDPRAAIGRLKGSSIAVRSWRGTYDRDIPL